MIVDGRGGAVGVGNLIKIIVRESMCQGVMGVRVSMSCRRRVCESSLCPSACSCEEELQLKGVTIEECTVFRGLCPCPRGASWLRPAWVR
jgi:hypothetical protein